MADSDYTVAVVLQASDEGMSAGLKGAAKGIEEAGNKAQKAKIDFMALMVGLEGLTSGLNQLTGGMRKMTSAMTQTGMATEDQTEKLNKQIAMVELFTGPMESLIAIVKLSTVAHAAYTGIVAIETGVVMSATIANYGLAVSLGLVTIGLFAFVAIVGLALLLLLDTERGLDLVASGLDKTAGALREVKDLMAEVRDIAVGGAQAVGDFFGNIDFERNLGGGSAMGGGRLA